MQDNSFDFGSEIMNEESQQGAVKALAANEYRFLKGVNEDNDRLAAQEQNSNPVKSLQVQKVQKYFANANAPGEASNQIQMQGFLLKKSDALLKK